MIITTDTNWKENVNFGLFSRSFVCASAVFLCLASGCTSLNILYNCAIQSLDEKKHDIFFCKLTLVVI